MNTEAKHKVKTISMRSIRVALIALLLTWCVIPIFGCGTGSSSGAPLATIAQQELDSYAEGSDGEKYWRWIGFSSRVPWCASFASYCADQAGLIQSGNCPKNAAVLGWIDFYRDNPEAGTLESGDTYKPQSGDFIIWQRSEDPDSSIDSHIGIVTEYNAETNQVTTIEGNSSRSVQKNTYDANSGISYYVHPSASGSMSSLAGCSISGSGSTTTIPEGLGRTHTYMGWSLITSPSSAQFKLREQAGENYDEEGFAKINNRYVIACTTTYGDVGDYIDWYLEDGSVLQTIIGDIKNQNDPGCNQWGHDNGQTIVEFVVDYNSWYPSHSNPGTQGCHPEWNQSITKAVNTGSYFKGDSASSSGTGLVSCSFMGNNADADALKAKLDLTEDYHDEFAHGNKSSADQKYIVLHDTEVDASPQNIVNSWDNADNGTAAHFVVGTDGSIVQCVPLDKIAHHAGYGDAGHNQKFGVTDESRDDKVGATPIGSSYPDYGMNSYSIGIEMVHVGGQGNYSDEQLKAVDDLIAYIDAYYGSESTIIDHKEWRTTNSDTSAEFADYLENYKDHRTHN